MELKKAVLILKGVKLGEGKTEPCRAVVRANGVDMSVILKELPLPAIAAECFAALLLREWGLNVPEPILVDMDGVLGYGSAEIGYPNLKQKFQYDSLPVELQQIALAHMTNIVKEWRQTPLAIAIDEVIGNKDRNIGNILWDGGEPYFIDHEKSFDLVPMQDANKLAALIWMGAGDTNHILKVAISVAGTLSLSVMQEAAATIPSLDTSRYTEYIKSRMPRLVGMVLNRFPQPQDLFSETIQ